MPDRRPETPIRMDIVSDPTLFEDTMGAAPRQPHRYGESPVTRFPRSERFVEPQLIGSGGMGLVFRALDVETGQHVAVKTLRRLDMEEVLRLKAEFRSLSAIVHPHLVELYELFVAGDDGFVTMELLDGVDFVRWVRAEELASQSALEPGETRAPLSPEGQIRLRHALSQLADGLDAVHQAKQLHRDIKPSNVMVTREGRVVILDFGLAARLVEGRALRPGIAGTPDYMAPEQARGEPLTSATDWYSVGVILFECLVGARPFSGDRLHEIAGRSGPPPDPRQARPALPADLAGLAQRLLAPVARERGGLTDVRRVLAGSSAESAHLPAAAADAFVGRAGELAALWGAWGQVGPARPAVVHLTGPSGMGKSETLAYFLHDLEETRGVLTLVGRCHPHETVPYKAFDAIVDALTHFLGRQPPHKVDAWVPPDASALLRVFPALRGVGALVEHRAHLAHGQEPQEIRRRAFAALRYLLARVAESTPLVLAIDDLHWGDLDSALLLRELLHPPEAPGLLVVLAWRKEEEAQNPVIRAILDADQLPSSWLTRVEMLPLPEQDLLTLARHILQQAPAQVDLAVLAQEAAGSPFFLSQLVRYHAAPHTPHSGQALPLSEVVQARVAQLDADARCLLEVVAVAGRPLTQRFALEAAGLGISGRTLIGRLQQAGLLRATALHDATALEAYHHRIRESVLDHMAGDQLIAHHRRLATVLDDAPGVDPVDLVFHYAGAQDPQRAREVALGAAERSLDTLAFDHAARLFQQALDLGLPTESQPEVQRKLAEVLALAGRGGEAGQAFEHAAAQAAAQGAPRTTVLTLQRRAGEQFLHSGRFEEGRALLGTVLRSLGLTLPATAGAAMRQMLWGRLRVMVRGLRFVERDKEDVAPSALVELDALWGASTGMAMVDHLVADAVGVTHFLRAMALGERSRVCRSLGFEAAFEATLGLPWLRPRLDRMLQRMQSLATTTGNPYDRAWFHLSSATCSWFRCEWQEVIEHADQARSLFRGQCRGVDWEIAVLESYALSAMANGGAMNKLLEHTTAAMRDAQNRGDLFALANCVVGLPALGWLAADRVATLRHETAGILAHLPPERFLTQHYHHLLATAHADLYEGNAHDAHQRVTSTWPRLVAAHFLQLTYIGAELHHLRGRTALALAIADPARRAGAVAEVQSMVRALRRDRSPVAAGFAALLQAGLGPLGNGPEQATLELEKARAVLSGLGMDLYVACIDRQLAALQNRAQDLGDADSRLHALGVVSPQRLAAMMVPVAC